MSPRSDFKASVCAKLLTFTEDELEALGAWTKTGLSKLTPTQIQFLAAIAKQGATYETVKKYMGWKTDNTWHVRSHIIGTIDPDNVDMREATKKFLNALRFQEAVHDPDGHYEKLKTKFKKKVGRIKGENTEFFNDRERALLEQWVESRFCNASPHQIKFLTAVVCYGLSGEELMKEMNWKADHSFSIFERIKKKVPKKELEMQKVVAKFLRSDFKDNFAWKFEDVLNNVDPPVFGIKPDEVLERPPAPENLKPQQCNLNNTSPDVLI